MDELYDWNSPADSSLDASDTIKLMPYPARFEHRFDDGSALDRHHILAAITYLSPPSLLADISHFITPGFTTTATASTVTISFI